MEGKKTDEIQELKTKEKKICYQFYKICKKKKIIKFIDVHTLHTNIMGIKFNPHFVGYNILLGG